MISPQTAPPYIYVRQTALWCLACGREGKLRRVIHRLEVVDRVLPALALELWREQHPGAWEQLALDFDLARDSGDIYSRQVWEAPAE